MHGVAVFGSLNEALHAGFQVYDRYESGYLVRCKTSSGWAFALARVAR